MAVAMAEMSLAAVPASTAGNENSRAHATIDQEISVKAFAEELKTLTDALFQFAERLTEISHKSLPLKKAIDLLNKMQTDSTQDTANDQVVIDKTDRCMGVADDLISIDKKGLNFQNCEELVRIRRQSPDIAGGADVNEDDLDVRAGNQGIMFVCMTDETVLQNKILRMIKKNHLTKYREILAEIAELNDDYKKFCEFGKRLKLGNHKSFIDGVGIAELLRFNTSKPMDEQISFKEYVHRVEQGQNDIYYITDESISVVSSSLFGEDLRKKGHEVLYMADPVDEYAVRQPSESDGTKLKPTMKEGLDLGEELKIEITADVSRLERNLEPHDANHENRLASNAQSLEPKSRQDLHDHLQQRTVERTANIPMITRVKDPAVQAEAQQQHKSSKHQPTKQAAQENERKSDGKVFREGEKKETGKENMKEKRGQVETEKGQEEREKGGREKAEVKKDVMDWTVVRRTRGRGRGWFRSSSR